MTRWDEIWSKQVSRGLLLFQPKDDPRWVVDRDWFKEMKGEGDCLNSQVEATKSLLETMDGICKRWLDGEELTMIEEILPALAEFIKSSGLEEKYPQLVEAGEEF